MNFAPLDWAIVGIYLLLSVTVGVLARKYVGSVADYLVAGRELGTYLGIATLAATEIGTITFMYNAEFGYRYGFAAFSPGADLRRRHDCGRPYRGRDCPFPGNEAHDRPGVF